MKNYLILFIFIFAFKNSAGQCWKDIKCGNAHVLALKNDSSLWSWGYNYFGQLGNGDTLFLDDTLPRQIVTQMKWLSIDCGDFYSAGIRNDHTLWTWGYDNHSALGNGLLNDTNLPAQIGVDTNWLEIATGSEHALARKTDYSLWAWGHNAYSQLGIGGTLNSASPLQVGNANDWAKIAAGNNHSIAQNSNKENFGFGGNSQNQLLSTTNCVYCDTTTLMALDTSWEQFHAGIQYTIGMKEGGTIYGWGFNLFGQLGNGTNVNTPLPTKIGPDSAWKSVAVGTNHCIAIKKDGTLWAWGANNKGQLGNGSYIDSNLPIQIGLDTNWSKAISGDFFSMALKTDGTLWSWGDNLHGQLGDGTKINKNTPTAVSCAATTLNSNLKNKIPAEVKIFPNPTSSNIEIESLLNIKLVNLFDMRGNLILKSFSNKMNLEVLKPGEYILEITFTNGAQKNTRVIKK
jgi:alpha-tubulin suppressor-like RCC1 family protein